MKVKVLEAIAYSVPTVVNDQGVEGLDADPAPPVRLAQSDDEAVHHVLDLLADPHACQRAADERRHCLRRSLSPEAVTAALVDLFEAQLRRPAP